MTERVWSHLVLNPRALNARLRLAVRRSFVIYAALLLIVGWAFAAWYVYGDRQRALDAAGAQLQAVADSLLVQMEAMLVDGIGSAQSALTDLGKFGVFADLADDIVTQELRGEVTGEYIRALFIGDATRTVAAGGQVAERTRGVPSWLGKAPALGETVVGLPMPDPSHGAASLQGRVIPVARGVTDDAQNPLWVGMWFDVDELLSRYQSISIERGAISLLSEDGWVLAGTAMPGRPPPLEVSVLGTELFDRIAAIGPGKVQVMEGGSAIDGTHKLYAAGRISADIPLLMVVSREQEAILTPWKRSALTVFWFSLGSSVLLIVMTLVLYRFLRELHRRESQFQKLFESSLVSIFLLKDGRIVEKNRHARRVFRVAEQDTLLGRTLEEISAPRQQDGQPSSEAIQLHYETLGQAGAAAFRWRFIRADSPEAFEAEVHLSTIEVGEEIVTLVMVRDISEQEKAKRELEEVNAQLEARVARRTAQLQEANAQLLETNRALEEFTGAASHDLRAPLGAISGQAGLLELTCGEALGDLGKQRLARIQQAVVRASDVIGGLLSLSSITRQTVKVEPVDLSKIAQMKLTELCEAEPERALEVFIQPGMMVRADRGLMESLVGNLIGNSWKYSSKRGQVWIRFERVGTRDGDDVYCVADRGAGFSMEHAPGLFQAFRRLHSSQELSGVGLGLATVHRIVSRYGGKIWAEAEPNVGAKFFFTMPGARCTPEEGEAESGGKDAASRYRSDQATG